MSINKTMICDRCGKEVSGNTGKTMWWHRTTILFNRFALWEDKEYRIDLCDDCTEEFRKWLKKEE